MSQSGDMREFDPAEYARDWASHPATTPAQDPRGEHHQAFEPDPEFVTLCRAAEERASHVELDVTAHAFHVTDGDGTQRHYRNLVALHVRSALPATHTRVTERFGVGEQLRTVARRVRVRLEGAR